MTQQLIIVDHRDIDLLKQVAVIHSEEIGQGFLTTLGPEILTDMYRTMAESNGSFVVACLKNGRTLQGFLAGSLGTHSLYREFLRLRSFNEIARLIAALFRPRRLWRILETLRYSERKSEADTLPKAEILNFCVESNSHRQGVGGKLMKFAETLYSNAGISQVRIVTGHSQVSANAFYRKLGVRWVKDLEIHSGTLSAMFVWDLVEARNA